MGQQVMDGDAVTGVGAIPGQVFREISLQTDLTLVDQLQDEERGELFGHRTDFKSCAGVVGGTPFLIGETEASLQEHAATASDEGCTVEITSREANLENAFDLRRRVSRGGGERDDQESTGNRPILRYHQRFPLFCFRLRRIGYGGHRGELAAYGIDYAVDEMN